MEVIPLRNYILLEYVQVSQKQGEIIIPEGAKLKGAVDYVIVRAVGPDVVGIAAGNRVVTNAYSGLGFEDEGKKFILVRDADVLAIIR